MRGGRCFPRWAAALLAPGLVACLASCGSRGEAAEHVPVDAVDLPLHEVPAAGSGSWLAMFISGDGGWADADRMLAHDLSGLGVAVVGLDARAYLWRRKTPREVSYDLAATMERYLRTWQRQRLLLIGDSRGADIMPFVANRLPDSLRQRVGLVALLSAAPWAGFEFHLRDELMDVRRATDQPVLPEVERLRGLPVLCIYGAGETNSLCRGIDSTLATPYERPGGHRLPIDEVASLAQMIVRALPH